MTTTTSDYLARLDEALRDVPHGIAAEIRAGIAEELSSLDPDAASQRIRQLGDPREIAREAVTAGSEGPMAPPAIVAAAPPQVVPTMSTRGFAMIAALSLGFAGYIVPFIGWVAGVVLVMMSAMWRTWEKAVAVLAPVALIGLLLLISLPVYATGGVAVGGSSGSGADPEAVNPLVPDLFGGMHLLSILAVIGVFLVIPASGLWLLWRMRGREVA